MVGVEGLEDLIGKLLPTLYMEDQCCPHLVVLLHYFFARDSARGEIELVVEDVL